VVPGEWWVVPRKREVVRWGSRGGSPEVVQVDGHLFSAPLQFVGPFDWRCTLPLDLLRDCTRYVAPRVRSVARPDRAPAGVG
jgi:hypothetical protein